MRGPVGGAVGRGTVAQMCGKLFGGGGAVYMGDLCVEELCWGAVWGLWRSIMGEVVWELCLGELWRGGGAVAGSSGGLGDPVSSIVHELLKTPRRCVGICVSGVCK